MSATVVRREPHYHGVDDDVYPEGHMLFVDPVLERTSESAGNIFRRIDAAERAAEVTLIRFGRAEDAKELRADPLLRELSGEVGTGLVGPINGSTRVISAPWSRLDAKPKVAQIRDLEVKSILRRCEAVYGGNKGHHFVLPSGRHAQRFIRLGDALRDEIEVKRISDWVVDCLGEVNRILGDSGSILPLLLSLKERMKGSDRGEVEFATLDAYPSNPGSIRALIDRLRRRSENIALVLSVNSTGSVLESFVRNCDDDDIAIVLVDASGEVSTTDVRIETQVLSSWAIGLQEVGKDDRCEICDAGPVISIHPRTYERLPNVEREVARLDIKAASANQDLWQAIDRAGAISLHVDVAYPMAGRTGQRHLPMWIDVEALLEDGAFRQTCCEELAKLDQPDVILTPSNTAAGSVAQLGKDVFPSARVHRVSSGRFEDSVRGDLKAAESIVIIDGTVVSGRTLVGLRDEVYRVTQEAGRNPKLDAVVFIARPDDLKTLRALRRRYTSDEGGFHSVYEVLMPTKQHACPWCEERRYLMQALEDLPAELRDQARRRLDHLRGKLGVPFVLGIGSERNEVRDVKTEGSFLGRLSRKSAFAAASSTALTEWRREAKNAIVEGMVVFDLELLLEAYFESTIVAGVLRTLPASSLRWRIRDRNVADQLLRLDPQRAYPGTIAEIGWAGVMQKVPPQAAFAMLDRVVEPNGTVAMVKGLLDEHV